MKKSSRPDISIVVPAYNEEHRLPGSIDKILKAGARLFGNYEIIVVSDGSTDATARVVEEKKRNCPHLRLVDYAENRGKGFAVRSGVLEARGERILVTDADLSTPLREYRKLAKAMDQGWDVAIGSRATDRSRILEYQPFYRVLMGKTFNKIVRFLAVRGFSDTQCGFKCFSREAAERIFPLARIDGFSFDVELLFIAQRRGLRVREVGVLWRNSPESKVHPVRDSLAMLREILLIRWNSLLGRYRESELSTARISTSSSR